MSTRWVSGGALAVGVAFGLLVAVPVLAQTQVAPKRPTAAKAEAAKSYTPPKTAWGDPDLQGNFTNRDESGIPFERPNAFEGKKIDDVADAELAELIKERASQAAQRAPGIGGAETGAGPVHWYENYDAKNSRPWLVIDPADGKIPPMTPEAQARIAAMPPARSSFTNGPWDSPEDFSLYDRCITRGIPGSMMPAIYGNSYQIVQAPGYVAIRYEMIHETRIIPLDGRPHLTPNIRTSWATPAVTGKARRSSSRRPISIRDPRIAMPTAPRSS